MKGKRIGIFQETNEEINKYRNSINTYNKLLVRKLISIKLVCNQLPIILYNNIEPTICYLKIKTIICNLKLKINIKNYIFNYLIYIYEINKKYKLEKYFKIWYDILK